MSNALVRFGSILFLALACGLGAMAQDEEATPKKKPVPKEVQEYKKKLQAQRSKERAKERAKAKAKAVDINHASKDQLKKLSGITDALADAIIAGRPYHSKAELVTKKVLEQGQYMVLSKQIAAK